MTLTLPLGSRRLRLFSLLVNSFLFLVSVEFVAEDYLRDAPDTVFTRLGAIYPDRAKLAIRYPGYRDPIHVMWRKVRQTSDPQAQHWVLGPSITLSESADWVNSTTISPLWPNTMYECNIFTPPPRCLVSHVQLDSLAGSDRQFLSYPQSPIKFKTFPDPNLPNSAPFRFVVSSCMKPNFPYVPFKGNRIKGMDLLADYLWPDDSKDRIVPSTTPVPLQHQDGHIANPPGRMTPPLPAEFMLFLGDFVYADVPYYFGDSLDAYRRLYRRNYHSPSFRRVYERLRGLQVLRL